MKTGAQRIAVERERQVGQEGWTAEHDDTHGNGDMAMAAACYAAAACYERLYVRGDAHTSDTVFTDPWPRDWEDKRRKHPNRASRIRMLVKAGALLAAEIDRLQREAGDETRKAGGDLSSRAVSEGENHQKTNEIGTSSPSKKEP